MSFSPRRIAVLTGDPGVSDPTKRGAQYNEEDVATHETMKTAFQSLGDYEFSFWNDHSLLLAQLCDQPPDLVINFCDTGFRNVPTQELHVPAFMELLGIPYSGAPPAAMVICYDKQIVRLVAEALAVPVPREFYLAADTAHHDLPDLYPALLKPNTADGSVGITKDAVVQDSKEAGDYLDWLKATLPGRDILWQEYLPGPEYGLGLIGNSESVIYALPALEVDFSGLPAGLNPILSYESKALPDSPYWTEIKFRRANLGEASEALMQSWAKRLFRRLGLRDYGRFDFRVGADGKIKLMEVNPNPAWANDGKLAFMASFADIAYPQMLRMILQAAIDRVDSSRG